MTLKDTADINILQTSFNDHTKSYQVNRRAQPPLPFSPTPDYYLLFFNYVGIVHPGNLGNLGRKNLSEFKYMMT